MLVCGTSDFNTLVKVAEGIARSGAYLYCVKSTHVYDLYELPDHNQLLKRLSDLKEDKREPVAIWVAGKRTK